MPSIREAALDYISQGWLVLPTFTVTAEGACLCGDVACNSAGKHPRGDLAPHGVHDATLDASIVASWPDDINIGVALGFNSGGLMVCDIDDEEVARTLLHPSVGLSDQVGVSATGRGCHLWLITSGQTATFNLQTKDGRRLGELRGDGAYVVAPPSTHALGRNYRWIGLQPTMKVPRIPTVVDALEFVSQLLESVGVQMETDRDNLIGLVSKDLPDIKVEPEDLPQALQDTGRLTNALQMLSGTLPQSGERSDHIYGVTEGIYFESLVIENELTLASLAGIAKKLDQSYFGKFTDRGNNTEYIRIGYKLAVIARPAMLKRAERERARGQSSQKKLQGPGVRTSRTYHFVPDDGILYLRRGRDFPPVANFIPEILADLEIDRGNDISRMWQMRFTLADGRSVEFFLPAEDRSGTAFSTAISKACPADFTVYPNMIDHVRTAAQELSANQYIRAHEYAASGWIDYGTERMYLLPGAAGAIGRNGLDPSIRINVDHLPEDEPIASPVLAPYGRGVRPPLSDTEHEEAWKAFSTLIRCGPPDLTMSLALQVLGGPLYRAGAGQSPPLVHVLGQTGSLKTSLCFVALSMFGTFDEDTGPPTNWGSTSNALQTMLHATRDLTLMIDDYKASVVRNRAGLMQLIQQYADGSVRQRQGFQQKLQQAHSPRGLILSNGEDVWEREASAEARTITLRVRKEDIDSPLLYEAADYVAAGSMQLFGGLFIQWLARHPEIFEEKKVTVYRKLLRNRLAETTKDLKIHLRVISSAAVLGAIGQILVLFIKEEYPEHVKEVSGWVREASEGLARGTRERGQTVAESSPFRQMAAEIIEALAAREATLLPAEGMTENRTRIPDTIADPVGYWFGKGPEPKEVLLTSRLTYTWLQERMRRRGEVIGFSWQAARNEAVDAYGAAIKQRIRVHTDTAGRTQQLSGVVIAFEQFQRAGAGASVEDEEETNVT